MTTRHNHEDAKHEENTKCLCFFARSAVFVLCGPAVFLPVCCGCRSRPSAFAATKAIRAGKVIDAGGKVDRQRRHPD